MSLVKTEMNKGQMSIAGPSQMGQVTGVYVHIITRCKYKNEFVDLEL